MSHSADWPLVGRDRELRLLRGMLERPGAGAVLAGPAGVGKTRLAGEALAVAAGLGLVTARVVATKTSSELPFAAIAGLLPPDEEAQPNADQGAQLLRRCAAALAERAEGGRYVLLVDDAHLLDATSAILVHQLAASRTAVLLVTVRSGTPAPDPVVALWKDGLLERLEVPGLDGEAVGELLGAVLGGPVEAATVARLSLRSEGNVLFLRELVLGALATGALAEDDGMWRLVSPLAPSERLIEIVESRLAGLDRSERDLLELVALGEPLGMAELGALGDAAVAETLERQGLLSCWEDGRRVQLSVAHPLHGEVIRTRISPLRSRNLRRDLADAVESTGARRADDTLRMATWRLAAGGASPDLLLAAATTARHRHDMVLGEQLARAAADAGGGFPARLLAAQLAGMAGRGDEAEAELVALAGEAGDDAARADLARARIHNLRFLGRFDDARVLAADNATVGGDTQRDLIEATRMTVVLDTDGPDAALAIGQPLLAGAEPPASLIAALFATFALARRGQTAAAVAVSEDGHAAHLRLRPGQRPFDHRAHWLARAEALQFAGRLGEAETLVATVYEQALAEEAVEVQAWAAWAFSKVLVTQGRAGAAARHGREAAALFRPLCRRPLLRDCLIPLAIAEAISGHAGRAADVVAEIDRLALARSGWTGVDLLQARAWTAVAAGDAAAARTFLEEAVAGAEATGDAVGPVSALHDLARLGHAADVTDALAEAAAKVEGDLAPARAAHAAALAAGDAAALERVSATFDSLGAWLFAAEAAASAAALRRAAGDPRGAAAAERRSAALAGRCGEVVTPALAGAQTADPLTEGERETALLAARGRTNKEIADELYLSVRTVENRLARAYAKLGVTSRAELAEALGS